MGYSQLQHLGFAVEAGRRKHTPQQVIRAQGTYWKMDITPKQNQAWHGTSLPQKQQELDRTWVFCLDPKCFKSIFGVDIVTYHESMSLGPSQVYLPTLTHWRAS